MDELFEFTEAEAKKVRRLYALMGMNDEEAIYTVLRGDRDSEPSTGEDVEFKAALKSFGASPSGRRRRDARGCVVDKPFDPRPARAAESNGQPRRDGQGYRITKPHDPRR